MLVTCERCGPYVRAVVTYRRGQSTWSFCDHHGREHHAKLSALGYTRQTLEVMAHG